jgi:hypothetical protein
MLVNLADREPRCMPACPPPSHTLRPFPAAGYAAEVAPACASLRAPTAAALARALVSAAPLGAQLAAVGAAAPDVLSWFVDEVARVAGPADPELPVALLLVLATVGAPAVVDHEGAGASAGAGAPSQEVPVASE